MSWPGPMSTTAFPTGVLSPMNRKPTVTGEQLEKIRDEHVRMSLELQQAFGLRREEAMKIQPMFADRGPARGARPRPEPTSGDEDIDRFFDNKPENSVFFDVPE